MCFLCTGQGSQYVGMGRELYERSPVFRAAMERCGAAWKEETGELLIEVLYAQESEVSSGQAESRMKRARYAQPSLFAFEYALAELWRSWGIEPSVVLGHSLGEYVAAVIAGVFSVEDGLGLVCARARLMDRLTQAGAMRSIAATAERVQQEIVGLESEVGIGVINGAETVVLSGLAETVERVGKKLEAAGIRTRALEVTHAFHSPLLEPILDEFEACAGKVKYHAPRIRIISNLTGKAARADEMTTARYWREHMRGTVQFDAGLKTALASGCQTLLEIGPQPHLLSLGKSGHNTSDHVWLPSVRKGRNPWLDLLGSVKTLYEFGAEINWNALHGKFGRLIALPTYPFERRRHWFPMKPEKISASLPLSLAGEHPLLGLRVNSPLAEIQFASQIGPDRPSYLGDHVVAGRRVVPAAAYLDMALSAAKAAGLAAPSESSSVRAVAFLQPCTFDEPRNLQCVLRSEEAGHSFAIYSCAVATETEEAAPEPRWILHATGELFSDARGQSLPENLDAIRERCGKEEDSRSFYDAFGEMDVHFGPSFRPVTRVFRGADEALVEFALPPNIESDADHYQIHPIALDACFQSVVAILLSAAHGPDAIYLPAALEELRILGDPRRLTLAHARLHRANPVGSGAPVTANVYGFDRSGHLLLSATGLVLRPLNPEDQERPRFNQISNSLYEVAWIPVEAATQDAFNTHGRDAQQSAHAAATAATKAIQGTWVLAGAADEPLSSSLSEAFARDGIPCAIIQPGEPTPKLAAIRKEMALPISDLVYFATPSLDISQVQPAEGMKLESQILGRCLRIVQALLALDLKATPRLWIVTRGAQGPALASVLQSTLWGFGRSVAAEYPEMRVVRLDLDPAHETTGEELLRLLRIHQSLPVLAAEDELAWRGNEIYCSRLRPIASLLTRDSSAKELNEHLVLLSAGTLDGIELTPTDRHSPDAGEIEICVHAAGLNFRDVLNVLGMYKGKSGPLGGECAGTVVRVGSGVTTFRPGDEVVALGPGCFSKFVTTRANMAWRKPETLSFEAAVTIPVAFLTAKYALETLAGIRSGDRVLIHAGAGGVGLAAIQIARKAGATIFATAGNGEKRAYLASIGVDHVMDSRTIEFVREIREITHGRGVDIVLNSLSGQFIDAGLDTLAPGGRFIEMGVADLRSQKSVAIAHPDVTYIPFNLAPALESGDGFVRETLTAIFDQFHSGALHPLPQQPFPLEKAQDAFRFMAQARHIGRVVLCPALDHNRVTIRPDGAYLVTGGLAGIGLAVAEWLSQRGAGQVILLGRSAPGAEAVEVLDRMRAAGTSVTICQGDVSKETDVAAALRSADQGPLLGVFHCAGVLDDGALLQQDWERFERVLSPKLEGAYHLHRLTADKPLDLFVLFSSVASVFGSEGQANHAAANAFLDAMAQYRHAHRLPALSVNWGPWSETGAAVQLRVVERKSKMGVRGISTRDGLQALEMLIADGRAQAVVAPIDWKQYFANSLESEGDLNRPLLRELRTLHAAKTATAPAQKKKNPSWLPQLESAASSQRMHILMDLIAERVKSTLGIGGTQEIDPSQPLQELGLDSLLSIELRNSLAACLGQTLPATLLFNYPTLDALAGFISREVFGDLPETAASGKTDFAPTNLVEDIEALSDEEVARLLSLRAAGGVR
ncbi:MAG: SDR family NAD(P)-dependent oxidoreductase [Acidobacteriaceae bacterium]